jgi:hypothetical protein
MSLINLDGALITIKIIVVRSFVRKFYWAMAVF